MIDQLLSDLRFTLRQLAGRPGFALVAVLSLALGIGANTAIFSLVNELFLSPLPIQEPSRVLSVFTTDERIPGDMQMSHLNWRDLRDQNEVFSGMAGYSFASVAVTRSGEEPQFEVAQLVSDNYFEVLGVAPTPGRAFELGSDAVPGSSPLAVLGHEYWMENFGGEDSAVGRDLIINGSTFTVAGVAPPGFKGLAVGVEPSLFLPFGMNRVLVPDESTNWFEERRGLFVSAFGRLTPGVTQNEAEANLQLIATRLEADYPDDNEGRNVSVMGVAEASIFPQLRQGLMAGTGMLMAVVGLVLLIACVNVANLLLARASERRKEIAMRLALGVSRQRLIGQLLTESLVISMLGGVVGLGVALVVRRLLLATLPSLPFGGGLSLDLSLDPRVLLFALGLSILTGLLFGLIPALQMSRPDLVSTLKDQDAGGGGGRRVSLRGVLVVAQLALSLVALLGAGLFVRSLFEAQKIELGIDTESLAVLNHNVGMAGFTPEQGGQFFDRVVQEAKALSEVESAAVAAGGPLQGTIFRSLVLPNAASDQERTFVQVNSVGSGYFETLGVDLVEGRAFTAVDRQDSEPVVIINQTMADLVWPDQSALGKEFAFFGRQPARVVGVARDIKYNSPVEDPQPYAYLPLSQDYASAVALIVRTRGDASSVLGTVERRFRELAPLVPITDSRTVPALVSASLFAPRLAAMFLGALGLLALVLAAIGVYGVMSHAVAQRSREIGIRVALGADRTSVLGFVMKRGLALTLVGLLIGLVVGFAVTRLLRNLLFVSPGDPLTFALISLLLLLVALVAVLVPAIRATGLDPIQVLRS